MILTKVRKEGRKGRGGEGKGEAPASPTGWPGWREPVVSPSWGLAVLGSSYPPQSASPPQRATVSSQTRVAGRSLQTGRLQVSERCACGGVPPALSPSRQLVSLGPQTGRVCCADVGQRDCWFRKPGYFWKEPYS